MATAISGVNSTYSPVMKPDFAVVVKRMPSVCDQKMTARIRPSQTPSSTPRRTMAMRWARMMANISPPASMKRRLISAPTEMPPSSASRVMGKPSPQIAATDAIISAADA